MRQLAIALVEEYFGGHVKKVFDILLLKGRLTLGMIAMHSRSTLPRTRESLFILLQHNLVTFAENQEGDRLVVYYTAEIRNALLLNRYPIMMAQAEKQFGEAGKHLTTQLLLAGKSSLRQLVEKTCQFSQSQSTEISETFSLMLSSGYIAQCHSSDSLSAADERLKMEAKAFEDAGTVMTTHQRAKIRQKLKTEGYLAIGKTSSTVAANKRKIVVDIDELPTKKLALEEDIEEETYVGASVVHETLYRINLDKLSVTIRNQDILDHVQRVCNRSASYIVEKLLDHSYSKLIDCPSLRLSVPMKKSDLKKIISNKDLKVEGLSDDPLDSYLKLLCEKEMSILSKEIDVHGTACYSVRLEQLGESIQLSLITSIIQQRFGDAGRRLWRILHAKGKLDDKQLAKFAMLPMKMTRELLYKMFKAKYVYIQDVPKTADHAPSRTFHLWAISVSECIDTTVQCLYATLKKLKSRREKEKETFSALIEKLSRSDVAANPDELLTDAEKKEQERMIKKLGLVQTCELRVELMIIALTDY